MPRVSFSFSGWVTEAEITKATDTEGKEVDVSCLAGEELAHRLNAGELFISLGDYLYGNSRKTEIELFDFEGA